MSGTPVEIYASLDLPPTVVRDALMNVMRAIGNREEPYANLALTLELKSPGHAQLRVPVEVTVVNRPGRWECGIHIEAAENDRLFPTFDGTLSVTPDGGRESELWLQGTYVPPGGALGKGVDAVLLHGSAENSLREFLDWIAGEVRDEVDRSERERAEQARRFHG
ncbi:MAG: hypothetical protein JO322_14670 [Candidatus Eremiobacteraeota bacterium]|nr:hypothetical protein [Candidatus Eremiobacteraeota bacterium]